MEIRAIVTAVTLGGLALGAEAAGDPNLIQLGWVRLMPQAQSGSLRTQLQPSLIGSLLGVDEDFVSPGTSSRVEDADTLLLTYSRSFGDHWSLKAEGGIPAQVDLHGEGVIAPTGPTGRLFNVDLGAARNNPLASAREWSPALILQYAFPAPGARLRPYVGAGVSYTWFTDIALDGDFENEINAEFGRLLALATANPGPTSVRAKASSSVAPMVTAGLSYALGEHWSVATSLSYVRLATTTTISVYADDGTRLARSTADLDVNPLAAAVVLGYRF